MQIKYVALLQRTQYRKREEANRIYRVRTLTGKEIELDIEPDYKVTWPSISQPHLYHFPHASIMNTADPSIT